MTEILNPTQVLDREWLYIIRPDPRFYEPNREQGKWIIQCTDVDVDAKWQAINALAADDKISRAKVVTRQGNKFLPRYIIHVVTYEWRDEEDVMRVRQHLRDAGFTEQLKYKPNWASTKGINSYSYVD